jgi:hypothetical protein
MVWWPWVAARSWTRGKSSLPFTTGTHPCPAHTPCPAHIPVLCASLSSAPLCPAHFLLYVPLTYILTCTIPSASPKTEWEECVPVPQRDDATGKYFMRAKVGLVLLGWWRDIIGGACYIYIYIYIYVYVYIDIYYMNTYVCARCVVRDLAFVLQTSAV